MHDGELRYFHELQEKFTALWRDALYVLGFIFLSLHLLHGFNSAFQSMGANNKYTKAMKTCGTLYAIIIPLGFIVIALFHHFNNH
jgi:succinate dehydrogenase / fumarate reductase cytochrome b subunit